MASKQLGKLRQWAGEKISSREKTVVIEDDLQELEQDIDLRKQGILRLQAASEDYHHVLSKKKESPASGEAEKLMPLDALGIVMVTHGEEYGDDSAFGTCLVALGRAQCKIATLQEAYGLTFRDTFLQSCDKFGQDIKDYEYQRKKLDSRRLSYDAAITKLEKIKSCKKEKEKERREAEDELQRCRLRFEETSEDVRSRIQTIQENEILQLRELTNFLDIQLSFAQQYFEVLQDAKASWCDESTLTKFEEMRLGIGSQSLAFSSAGDDKYAYARSTRSTLSNRTPSEESGDDPGRLTPVRRKSDSSRPTSRASYKRSDSNLPATGNEGTTKASKRMSVTGWASNAVSSITGLGKKDRDTFTALMNEDEEKDSGSTPDVSRPPSSRSSRKSPKIRSVDLPFETPKTNGRILKPPSQQEKKLVKALYNFTGSSDELSFRAGDEITVIHEVLDDWWLGMHKDGRKGLFPATYTEPVFKAHRSSPFGSDSGHPDPGDQIDDKESVHDYMNQPYSANSLGFDTRSVTSSVAEDEEEQHLMPLKPSDDDSTFPDLPPRQDIPTPPPVLFNRTNSDIPKKPPPPPPPRRATATAMPPPIPDRRPQTESASSSVRIYTTAPDGTFGQGISPFDSLVDTSSRCVAFEQHPQERKGLCKNCFRMH